MRQRFAAFFVVFAAALAMAGSAHAAVFNVNTTNDTRDADVADPACADAAGDCSLRAAIDQANENPDDDTINLPNGRYVLTLENEERSENDNATGDLDIGTNGPQGGDTDIVGESTEDTIVDANGIDRVFHVFDGSESQQSFDVDMSDLTVTGGVTQETGGGILNEVWDTLTLTRARVTRNFAGGGGGIANHAHTVLLESTVDRNEAFTRGGGVCSSGELNMADSTVSDNVTGTVFVLLPGDGGGIFAGPRNDCEGFEFEPCVECPGSFEASGADGAVASQIEGEPDLTIENSTIDGNDVPSFGSGGGIALDDRTATLLNVTLSDNTALDEGGGLYAQGQSIAEFKNTIVADNRVEGEGVNCGGAGFVDLGHNLESHEDCVFTESTSKQNASALLARLGDNGGPTHTRALRDGSAALDSADNDACPADDQRGETRPPDGANAGPACDIGAYERVTPPAPQQPAPVIQQQQQQPQQQACTPAAPRSSVSSNSLIGRENTLKFTGRATDLLCSETRLPGEVSRLRIAVAQIVSNTAGSRRCRFLTADGDLTRTRSCDDEVFLSARLGKVRNGKVPWTFRKRRLELPAGRYQVLALGTDTDGLGETAIRRHNLKRFTVR